MSVNPTQNVQAEAIPAAGQPVATPAQQPEDKAACSPAGFEDFDLDDIEVIESKVFA
ncbi:3-thiaglutamate biosynthesis pearlin carrier peptide TglA [Verminephrobacter eiseniae]|uniref:3-thiaglutamate biosynthesis pearlin carrier peptide TglA n=1 Tax=Verminephrobacter eiseniae TaxID=364317 RepID=UPI00223835CC|nr:TglA family RiPP precursor [Verminephrobacter eiseniae]